VAVLGFYAVPKPDTPDTLDEKYEDPVSGRVTVFGDSSCLDTAGRTERKNCFWLAKEMLGYTSQAILPSFAQEHTRLKDNYVSKRLNEPERIEGNQLFKYSKVLGHLEPVCSQLAFQHVALSENNVATLKWPVRKTYNPPFCN